MRGARASSSSHRRRRIVVVASSSSRRRPLLRELARRRGDEKRSLIEALPEILGAGERAGGQTGRVRGEFDLAFVGDGNRPIDAALQDDFLTHVYDLEVSELEDILTALTEAEREVSETRRSIQVVFDTVQQVISDRYRETVVGDLPD